MLGTHIRLYDPQRGPLGIVIGVTGTADAIFAVRVRYFETGAVVEEIPDHLWEAEMHRCPVCCAESAFPCGCYLDEVDPEPDCAHGPDDPPCAACSYDCPAFVGRYPMGIGCYCDDCNPDPAVAP